jgi:peptidoglycan/xylan/chitin deacetylase (PgdA/CDA1 family)
MLTYHRVLPNPEAVAAYPLPSICIDRASFRSHLETLGTIGELCTVSDALSKLPPHPREARPLICITFDDGYDDNHVVAADCLGYASAPATFFVVTRFVSGRLGSLWFDLAFRCWEESPSSCVEAMGNLADEAGSHADWIRWLKRPEQRHRTEILSDLASRLDLDTDDARFRAMTIDQVMDLRQRGHEIGSHTATHPMLDQLSKEALDAELDESQNDLRSFGLDSPTGIAFPNGNSNDAVERAAQCAGFIYGLTTRPGTNGPAEQRYRMRRLDTDPRWTTATSSATTSVSILAEISGLHEVFRRIHW